MSRTRQRGLDGVPGALLAVVVALATSLVPADAAQPAPAASTWPGSRAWECREGRCRAADDPLASTPRRVPLHQVSQSVCRLHCGQYGALWPRPTGSTSIGQQVVAIDPARIKILASSASAARLSQSARLAASAAPSGVTAQAVVQEAVRGLDASLKRMCDPVQGCVPGDHGLTVSVNTTSAEHELNWDSDESYRLEVTTKGGVVRAQVLATTAWGARHGVQTLFQLIAGTSMPGPSPGSPSKMMLVAVSSALVSDAPKYPHRGLLLDTARHFLPLSAMLRTVDAMAASKLNVLHWHATDSHSFPLLLPSAPQMARHGAYSAREVYTPAAVSRLLRYARLRGVRVIVELDAPAHCSAGWSWGEEAGVGPLVLCAAAQPWRQFCIQPPCGQLNPTNPAVYSVLRAIYRDLTRGGALPPGEALHLGGDEVFFPCWNSSAEVTDYLQALGRGRGDADFLRLWAEFHAGALAALDEAAGRRDPPVPAIVWSSHLTRPPHVDKYLDKRRYIIETWTESGDRLPEELLARGYRIILAAKDAWYLDHGWWGRTSYHSWRAVRDRRLPVAPAGSSGTVLGGEAALWGELADDAALDAKLWPRAAALAERLWSDPAEPSSAPGVEARLLAHRERLLAMGVQAEAVAPEWCQLHDGECK